MCRQYNLLAAHQRPNDKAGVDGSCGWHARHETVLRFMWSLVTGSVAVGAVFYRRRIKQPIQSLDALV